MPELTPEKIALFDRLLAGKLVAGDAEALTAWLGSQQPDAATVALVAQQLRRLNADEQAIPQELITRLEQRIPLIFAAAPTQKSLLRSLTSNRWVRYAAAVVLLLGLGFLMQRAFNSNDTREASPIAHNPLPEKIEPGKEGAILTLVDGTQVVLDSLGNGLITTQNGTRVLLRNGQLVYDGNNDGAVVVGYNSMSTPKGRQFKLVLPDGTNVWLNAASSIRYPIVFSGAERRVEITGEAYFEVAHNKELPFRVAAAGGTEIEVLGTHFNINSYDNEETINTTLLAGSVRVTSNGENIILKPGEQAQSTTAAGPINVKYEVNTAQVTAWKNGIFDFQDATLEQVMRQLERWYDIDVSYEKNIPKLEFYGKMGKDLSLETVLNGLEKSNVHFRREAGRKLVVLP